MKPIHAAISSFLLFLALYLAPVSAQVFKCVDTNGKVTYSNDRGPGKGCKQLSNEQSVSTISMRSNPSAVALPRVSDETQRERDKVRRQILERELNSEQLELEKARQELAEQESVFQGGEAFMNQKTGVRGINNEKRLERLQPYRDTVERRKRNVEALTQELSDLR